MTLNASSLKMLRFCYSTCKDPLFRRIPADPRQAMAGPQFQDEVLQIELELKDSSSRPGLKPNKSTPVITTIGWVFIWMWLEAARRDASLYT
jgi:hypothetical protein